MTCPSCGRENPEGFRFCGFCGASLDPDATVPLEERKVVTVLFCDLVGFTARSDRADPEDVKATLRPFHTRIKREIEAFGGTLDKFIGDAALGVFGSPVAHEDDPERAVRAALAIQAAMAEMNDADPELGLAARVGVNTGEAVVAYGSGPQIGEAVTGDVVNTASRLQAVAPTGGIAVGGSTYRATAEMFVYEPIEPVTVKGKAEPLSVWLAISARGRYGADFTRAHTTPFVGREDDLSRLVGAFDASSRGRSVQLVTIVGEPGVGKSRLVAELAVHVEELTDLVTWRHGRCLPYGEGVTFWPLSEIVKAHAGILDSDPPQEAADKLDAVIRGDEVDREWLKQRLAPLVGIEAATPAERDEMFTAWRRFLEIIASTSPAVFVFEDIHWADDAMLGFIEHVAAGSEGVPMLLVCTARPELHDRAPGWGTAGPNAAWIELRPLDAAETARLVSGLLDHAALPDEVQELLLERAGGNPLYAEEFVRMLKDQRALVRADGTWALAEGADVRFPESIQSLIAARLDTLPPASKALLQDASVVGKVFWSGVLARMGERLDEVVDAALAELSGKELVRPLDVSTIGGEAGYAFWHALVRDVCYGQIPRAARAEKHRAVAAWLEGAAAERLEDVAEVLAHHYTTAMDLARASGAKQQAAGIEGRALTYLGMAGDRALGLDVARADAHYAAALDLAPPGHPSRPELLAKRADAVRQMGRAPEAAASLEEATRAFLDRGDRLAAGRAMGTLSSVLMTLGSAEQEEMAAEAVRLLEGEDPGPDLIAAYARMAGVRLVLGDFREAISWVDRATELAEELGLEVPPRALGFRGYARCSLGDPAGLSEMRAALAQAVERGEGRDAAVLHNNLAVALSPIEGPARVLAACQEGIEFAERRGIQEFALAISAASLDPLVEVGAWDRALELAGTIARQSEESGDVADLLQARWVQTRILAGRGQAGRAAPLAAWLVGAARESGSPEDIIPSLAAVSRTYLELDRPAEALELLAEVDRMPHAREGPTYPAYLCELMRTAVAAGDAPLAASLAEGLEPVFALHEHALCAADAILLEARGEHEAAGRRYEEAAGRWHGFQVVPERAHALLGSARCAFAGGRPVDAAEAAREAREIFAALGAAPSVAEAGALLAEQGPSPA